MKLTIFTLYKYEPNLFDNMVLPDGVDHDQVVNTILEECGEFGSIYPDPEFMQFIIGVWSKNQLTAWMKLQTTVSITYEPINNYDRYEESERVVTGTATGQETAFNSNTLQDVSGSVSDGDDKFTSHVYGNIGVTTTQQMLEQERKIAEFSMVEYISNSFKNKFCIEVYA